MVTKGECLMREKWGQRVSASLKGVGTRVSASLEGGGGWGTKDECLMGKAWDIFTFDSW